MKPFLATLFVILIAIFVVLLIVVEEPGKTKGGVEFEVLREGSGPEAKVGDRVYINYKGWLTNGFEFDSSDRKGKPLDFILGADEVIHGWDEGIRGMRVGEKRHLKIPARLGYGTKQMGDIPPDSDLIFDVELLQIKSGTFAR